MARLKFTRLKCATLIENLIALGILSISLSLSLLIIGKVSASFSSIEHQNWFLEVAEVSNVSNLDVEGDLRTVSPNDQLKTISTSNGVHHKIMRLDE